MRIGVTTHNYPPHLGGLEAIVHELVRGFAKHHEVVVLTTAWESASGIALEDGATVHRVAAWHGLERRGVPYAVPFGPGILAAVQTLRECDVVHAHGSLYATTVLAAALCSRQRLFVTEHVGRVPYDSRILKAAQSFAWSAVGTPIIHRTRQVITYNTRVQRDLAEHFGSHVVKFIANGVDTLRFRPFSCEERRAARQRLNLPDGEVLCLFVGRAAGKKNLEAVLGFRQRAYRLVVCGAKRTLPPDVFNLGAVPYSQMPEVYAAADFMIHAAVGEGFPVAVQEAMACGLAVALLWDDGYSGAVAQEVVVHAGSLEALSQAGNLLGMDQTLRVALGRRARAYALLRWNWETTVMSHLDLFEKALGGGL